MSSSSLLINEPPLQVLPTLARKIGLNEAIIIQQVHYWLNPKFNKNHFEGRYWVRNTYDQWQQQFPFWGIMTIRRAITRLEELGLLITFVTRDFKKNKYYSINYLLLENLAGEPDMHRQEKAENQGSHPSVQNGHIDLLKATNQDDQHGQADLTKVYRSYNKDTEITLENTLHPLEVSPSNAAKEEDDELKKLVKIWNETVQEILHPGKEIFPTPKRLSAFKTFLKEVFQGDHSRWQAYCEKISQIRFLMGHNTSGFKVTLDWALIPENAFKILEGAIYDKPSAEPTLPSKNENLLEHCKETPWGQISQYLLDKIGINSYKSWFTKTNLVDIGEKEVTLQVDSSFARTYIISHFTQELERAIQAVFPSIKHIHYQIKESTPC